MASTVVSTTTAYGRRSDDPDFDPYCGKDRVAELVALGLMKEPPPDPRGQSK